MALELSQHPDRVRSAVVTLSDHNVPESGAGKHCRLRIRLNGLPDIIINETEAGVQLAVNRAADRARRTLAHRLQIARRPVSRDL